MKCISLKSFGDKLGTRHVGAKVRAFIEEDLKVSEKVTVDFSGVSLLTNSFADECFAKLLLESGISGVKDRIKFQNITSEAKAIIFGALKDRTALYGKVAA